jgi:anti-anti-sigma factor
MFQTKKVSQEEIILLISGSMTGDSVRRFETALDALRQSHYRKITLDLSNVTEVSSLFIGHILHSHKNLTSQNRQIRICGYQPSVGDILKLLNVDKSIHMEQDSLCAE